MPLAIDPNTPFDYVVKDDQNLPTESKTVFSIRPLTEREAREFEGGIKVDSKTGQFTLDNREAEYQLLLRGLVGWRNFRDADGNDVEFLLDGKGKCDPKNLDRIAQKYRTELADAIQSGMILTEADAGN